MEERYFLLDADTVKIFQELYFDHSDAILSDNRVALGTIRDGEPAALLIAEIAYETVWLNWLFVREDFRKRGVATRLLDHFANSLANTLMDLEIRVSCKDEDVRHCLSSFGFDFEDEPTLPLFESTAMDLTELPEPEKPEEVKMLSELNPADLKVLNHTLWHEDQVSIGIELPVNPDHFMKESGVYIRDGKLLAALFLEKSLKGINIAYAYLSGNNGKYLFSILSEARFDILDRYDENIPISTVALNKNSEKLMEHLFPHAKKSFVNTGVMIPVY